MGKSQRSSTPKDHHNWRIKFNSFSDIREFISLPEVEGQSYLQLSIHDSRKQQRWGESGMKPEGEEEAESSAGEHA